MSVTITHSGGSRQVDAYRVISDPAEFELRGESNRAGKLVTRGDSGQRPVPLEVEIDVQEASFAASMQLASIIRDEAKQATSITLPRGTRTVTGILEHAITSNGPSVSLRLHFKPTGGGYS